MLVFSVGGGNREKNVSVNLVRAARAGARAGRAPSSASSAGTAARPRAAAEACVVIPTVSPERITPHTEGLCAVVWHLLVSHPALKRAATKWESTK